MLTDTWRVICGDEVLCKTEWAPLAQAAWERASRNGAVAQRNGMAILEKNGTTLISVRPLRGVGHPWPDRTVQESDWNDVIKNILLVLREDEWDVKEIAQAMTDLGLPTTRGRIDSLRESNAHISPAEIVVLLQAVIHKYREATDPSENQ